MELYKSKILPLEKKYNCYADSKEKTEYLDWCNEWMNEMVRITKPTGAIFVHNIPRWLTHFAEHLNKILITAARIITTDVRLKTINQSSINHSI